METWRKNLYSLWFAQFVTAIGLSMVIPFLPLYVRELGVTEASRVKIWSGLIFSAPFMVAMFLQPLWGILGDRRGRKPMVVRAMFGLALANLLMGFARNVPELLALRFFQGSLSGFVAPSLALLASCTPKERTGQALGTLQSSLVTGMIIGPLFGGFLAHFIGYRPIFFWTGFFCLIGGLIVVKFIKEDFVRDNGKRKPGLKENLSQVFHSPQLRMMLVLLIVAQFSIMLATPFLSLYVEMLKVSPEYVALMTGIVFGITGVANAIMAPFWGKRGDRIGHYRILRYSLTGMTVFFVPQAFVTDAYQLLILRAGLGIFIAGLMPTINTIVQRNTAEQARGGIYGIFQSGLLLGNMAGPLLGGLMAASLGLRTIFGITAALVLCVSAWERKMEGKNFPERPKEAVSPEIPA